MWNLILRLALKTYFAELILQLTYPKLYFEGQAFAILGQNHKNKIRNNLFRNNL